MAIIAMFYGIIVSMYHFDKRRHHMPHIHVKYQEQEAVIAIPGGEVLEGELKPNKRGWSKRGLKYTKRI